ncbi:MAG TPA: response regulator [Polyangia bacterium]|jgi:DNA-binding response OmpR family regulator|nr:response regulator [Polyangia bacterium]
MSVVLVVDDDFDLLAALSETLTDEAWEVLAVGSASAAVRAARSGRVDVVLTDVMMPFGDGQTFESTFRADPVFKDVPFAFMSGASKYVRGLHDARVLVKPFETEEVVAMLKSCLPNDDSGDQTGV